MTLALLLVVAGVNAQKIDQRLLRLASQNAEMKQGRRASAQRVVAVTAYLKEDAECPTKLLEEKGIKVHRVIDNMVSMTVPVEKLKEFEAIDEFILVNPTTVSRTFNMEAGKSSKASIVNDATQAVANGLPRAYTGKGVVVGIIDTGIDYNHAAFLDANGNTRVVKVLNLIPDFETGGSFQEFSDPAQIATATCDNVRESHGTHTSAIAVGSERGNSLHGVATEAEIILVGRSALGNDEHTVDAIDKIFKYADSKNMPAVINISMGHMNDLHDGSTLIAKAIKQQTNGGTKPGRIVVMSAGNSADNRYSIVKTLGSADANGWQLKTVIGSDNVPTTANMPEYSSVNVFMYANDGKEFTAILKAVNIETGEVKDVSAVSESLFEPVVDLGEKININGKEVVTWTVSATECTMKGKDWRLAIFVKGTAGQTIMMVRSDENVKEWGFYAPEKLKVQDYTDGGPDIAFNSDACDDAVISVGAYTTLTGWADYYVNMKHFIPSKITGKEQVVGEIADFSSFCVDNNGKNRPTVLAPGQGLLSALNGYDLSFFTGGIPNTENDLTFLCPAAMMVTDNNDPRCHWYGMQAGTSMSSPHTAGIVALWLQANPQLTEQQVVEIIKQTSMKDDFVTDVTKIPSHNLVQAANGKIDALAGLKKILNTSGIETIEVGGHREATPATMYSVDAPVYNMMGQRVNKNTHGMVIYKGRKYVNK